MKLLSQGAESKIYLIFENNIKYILKSRFSKKYRIPELDKVLIKKRMKTEIKILKEAPVLVPKFIRVLNSNSFLMEYIDGTVLKNILENNIDLSFKIGQIVAKLHNSNIIHSDLTTSNFMLDINNNIYIIDFGLSYISNRLEDKAVDIHLFKQAIISKHHSKFDEIYSLFLKGYMECNNFDNILNRLQIVELRGRNKTKGVKV